MNEVPVELKIVESMEIEIFKIEMTNYFGTLLDVLIEYNNLRMIIRKMKISKNNDELIIVFPDEFLFTNDSVQRVFFERIKQLLVGSKWILQNLKMLN